MKAFLEKICEINSKHWGLVLESNPAKYKDYHSAYMADIEAAIQNYVISFCDCKPEETTGCISEYVCNNCGRTQRA